MHRPVARRSHQHRPRPAVAGIAHGALSLENLPRDYGIKRRRLEVLKLRGSAFREGYHDYGIKKGGLSVYPRLVAAEHKTKFLHEQISSGIKELDDLVGGGINRGTSTLVMGPAGAGKSTIAGRYAFAAMDSGSGAARPDWTRDADAGGCQLSGGFGAFATLLRNEGGSQA